MNPRRRSFPRDPPIARGRTRARARDLCRTTRTRGGAPAYWPDPDFERAHIRPQQDNRLEADAWQQTVANYAPLSRVRVTDVAREALNLEMSRIGTAEQRRIASILTTGLEIEAGLSRALLLAIGMMHMTDMTDMTHISMEGISARTRIGSVERMRGVSCVMYTITHYAEIANQKENVK